MASGERRLIRRRGRFVVTGRRDKRWEDTLRDAVDSGGFGTEHDYYGCQDFDRALEVGRALRAAARSMKISCKAYAVPCDADPCPGDDPGAPCQWHVLFTCYGTQAARRYKIEQSRLPGGGYRHGYLSPEAAARIRAEEGYR